MGVEVRGIDLSPRMIQHARRLHPGVTFEVASVTAIAPQARSLGGVLGWWSWFNLPRPILPQVIVRMADALRPGGLLLLGTHCGDGDVHRSEAYGGVPVRWTTHLYQPEPLAEMMTSAGLEVTVQFRFPPARPQREQLLIAARKPALD